MASTAGITLMVRGLIPTRTPFPATESLALALGLLWRPKLPGAIRRSLAILAALVLGGCGGIRSGPHSPTALTCIAGYHHPAGHPDRCIGDSSPSDIPPEPLQLRQVLSTVQFGCSPVRLDFVAPTDQPVTLPQPNAPSTQPCLRLGAALFQSHRAAQVQTSLSPAGRVLVKVLLEAKDVAKFDHVVQTSGHMTFAMVLLGQVLSLATAEPELRQPAALAGHIQVAGGLGPDDPRPFQIAEALDAPLSFVGGDHTSR